MNEEAKAVETNQVAAPEGVETMSDNAPLDDPEARLKSLQEELSNVKRDRDNYRSGLLAMKGKTEVEDLDLTDPIQIASYINKTVEDRLLASKEQKAEQDLHKLTEDLARKNKELSLALANRTSISSGASSGSGTQEKMAATSPDKYWSDEQIRQFRDQGKDDAWIKRAADNARKMGA